MVCSHIQEKLKYEGSDIWYKNNYLGLRECIIHWTKRHCVMPSFIISTLAVFFFSDFALFFNPERVIVTPQRFILSEVVIAFLPRRLSWRNCSWKLIINLRKTLLTSASDPATQKSWPCKDSCASFILFRHTSGPDQLVWSVMLIFLSWDSIFMANMFQIQAQAYPVSTTLAVRAK